MYYTNIKDYEQLLSKSEEQTHAADLVLTIVFCLITILLI